MKTKKRPAGGHSRPARRRREKPDVGGRSAGPLFVLYKRINWNEPALFLQRPRMRGAMHVRASDLTADAQHAITWTEKSGAHKYLKRHRHLLAGFHVAQIRRPAARPTPPQGLEDES